MRKYISLLLTFIMGVLRSLYPFLSILFTFVYSRLLNPILVNISRFNKSIKFYFVSLHGRLMRSDGFVLSMLMFLIYFVSFLFFISFKKFIIFSTIYFVQGWIYFFIYFYIRDITTSIYHIVLNKYNYAISKNPKSFYHLQLLIKYINYLVKYIRDLLYRLGVFRFSYMDSSIFNLTIHLIGCLHNIVVFSFAAYFGFIELSHLFINILPLYVLKLFYLKLPSYFISIIIKIFLTTLLSLFSVFLVFSYLCCLFSLLYYFFRFFFLLPYIKLRFLHLYETIYLPNLDLLNRKVCNTEIPSSYIKYMDDYLKKRIWNNEDNFQKKIMEVINPPKDREPTIKVPGWLIVFTIFTCLLYLVFISYFNVILFWYDPVKFKYLDMDEEDLFRGKFNE